MRADSNSKGFTLLELLVVIAIIGVLSAIIMAVTNKPRNDAVIANIKTNLRTIQKQAELYYLINGTYGVVSTACDNNNTMFADKTIKGAVSEIKKHANNGTVRCVVKNNGNKWAFSVFMNGAVDYCVDSAGYFGTVPLYMYALSGSCTP